MTAELYLDARYYQKVIELAEDSKDESDDKKHPKVGATVYARSSTDPSAPLESEPAASGARAAFHHGEHAEHGVLERCLIDTNLHGRNYALFSTLEPCTKRSPPKKACTDRIIARGAKHVYIGLLDPNPKIYGGGAWKMVRNNIEVHYFPPSFCHQIYESNSGFIKDQEQSFNIDIFRQEFPQAYVHPQEPFLALVYGLFRRYGQYKREAVVLFNTRLKTFADIHEFQASIAQGLFYNPYIRDVYVLAKKQELQTLRQRIADNPVLRTELHYWCYNTDKRRCLKEMRMRFKALDDKKEDARCILFLNKQPQNGADAEFGVFNTAPEWYEDDPLPRVLLGVASKHSSPSLKGKDNYAPLLASAKKVVDKVVNDLGGWDGSGWFDLDQLLAEASVLR